MNNFSENKSWIEKVINVLKIVLDGLIISIFLAVPVILITGAFNAIFGIESRERIGIGLTDTVGLGSDFGLILRLTVGMVALGAVLALVRYPKTIWEWLKLRPWAKWGLAALVTLLLAGWLVAEFRQTPTEQLASAINGGDPAEVEAVLNRNEIAQSYLDSQLSRTVREKSFDLAETLMANGANINYLERGDDFTLLQTAILLDDIETILFLIENGADLTVINSLGDTPLMTLIEFRLSKENMSRAEGAEIVRAMLAAGADSSHQNDFGQTARDYAEERGYSEILAVLP